MFLRTNLPSEQVGSSKAKVEYWDVDIVLHPQNPPRELQMRKLGTLASGLAMPAKPLAGDEIAACQDLPFN
ncbi:hypothetical protein Dda_8310 [Drechslerella dactyloides]|uniref:Uncharacterized protein n=1 Tax=Drechslerella dactyloides TaxID=74499 RepID=A0AAD6IRT2_DREDA|nr:hypothetical protein Dda_8310 [Drechslerella dactyloides]